MDLVGFDRAVFDAIRDDFAELLPAARASTPSRSARCTATTSSRAAPARRGSTGRRCCQYLETVEVERSGAPGAVPVPVQLVVRPDHDFRGYAGQIGLGPRPRRRPLTVWPSGLHDAHHADRDVGRRPRGGVRADVGDARRSTTSSTSAAATSSPAAPLQVGQPASKRDVVWMDERPLEPGRMYLLKHDARTVTAEVDRGLALNEIGTVDDHDRRGRCCSIPTRTTATTGSFILIDPATNFTAGRRHDRRRRARAAGHGAAAGRRRAARAARAAPRPAKPRRSTPSARVLEEILI